MISPKTFKKYKLDSKSLEKLFTAKTPSKEIKKLIELLAARNKDGIERCLKDHRTWAAADLAYNPNSKQEAPAIIRHILSSCGTDAEIGEACKSWGIPISDMFCHTGRKDEKGREILELNPPLFHEVDLPVVSSYLTIRTAKIFNDRNVVPLHKYEPSTFTGENRVVCEMVTKLIEAQTAQFGYSTVLRQVIFQTNHYSDCMLFPLEPWHEEKQEGENEKVTTIRAGVRYATPHKSRYWYDLGHPLASFNTDTGCSFAGYWSIQKWGDVERNPDYWNKERVGYGNNWLDSQKPWHNYFKSAYLCTLKFPEGGGKTSTDRETLAERYTAADNDKACFLGYQFAKLVPKDWGMGDYKYPVWFRFILAGDDTVLWAEPFPYRAVLVAQYDADQNSGCNMSMTTQVRPFQTLMENLVTQLLLTIKRNLSSVIFYDKNQFQGEALNELKRNPTKQYTQSNFVAFDGLLDPIGRKDSRAAIHEVKYAYADTSQIIGAFNIVNGLLERSLVISPQEIGAAASHQQSVKEIVTIQANTTNRVAYTASFIDDFMDAWQRQLYEAFQAFGSDEITSEVSGDIPDVEKHLKALGIEVTGKLENGKKLAVKGKKNALRVESFASRRTGPERKNDTATSQAMFQALMSLNQNQMLAAVADPASVLQLLEQAAKLAGADPDFKIHVNKDALKSELLKASIAEIEKMIMQQVDQSVTQPAAKAVAAQDQEIAAQKQELGQIVEMVGKLQDMVMAAQAAPPLPQPQLMDQPLPLPPPNGNQPNILALEPTGLPPGMVAPGGI